MGGILARLMMLGCDVAYQGWNHIIDHALCGRSGKVSIGVYLQQVD